MSAEDGPAKAGTKMFETNDEGEPIVTIAPAENVYSFLFFMAPIEELRAPGQLTTPKILAWLAVIIALVLQSVVIYAVWKEIVLGQVDWQLSVVRHAPPAGQCVTDPSMCKMLPDGTVTCAPPSVQIAGRWNELDVNGDGNWTREEAAEMKDHFSCEFQVNLVEVFDVFATFLVNREKIIWIHPSIREGQGIPEMYFKYAAGDIIMCGYRNKDMCPNLLKRGYFDVPLAQGTVPRVGETIKSALAYCHAMLEDGGVCDTTLPSTYTVWKKSSDEQCYGAGYSKFVYTHPENGQTKSMLTVDYAATKDYRKAERSTLFMMYKACVIMVLLCCIFSELRQIVPLVTFVAIFPSEEEVKSKGKEPIEMEVNPEDDDDVKYKIQGITSTHRASVLFVLALRLMISLMLLFVGVNFLLKETDYLNLILNGLGLLFVVALPADLYNQLLNPYLRSKVEHVQPVEVPLRGLKSLNRNPPLKDILWLVAMFVLLVVSMYIYTMVVVKPITGALQCACLSEGHDCREATAFSKDFWDTYWQTEVPGAIADIKEYEAAFKAGKTANLNLHAAQAANSVYATRSARSKRHLRERKMTLSDSI